MYMALSASGNKNKSGANIRIKTTAITEPNIKPNHNTNPVIIKKVTIVFQMIRNGKNIMFFKVFMKGIGIRLEKKQGQSTVFF